MSLADELQTDVHSPLSEELERLGLRERDFSIVPATSTAAVVFTLGKVDASFTYEPYRSAAVERGEGALTFTASDVTDTMIDVLEASDAMLRSRADDLLALLPARLEALEWIDESPEDRGLAPPRQSAAEGVRPEGIGD